MSNFSLSWTEAGLLLALIFIIWMAFTNQDLKENMSRSFKKLTQQSLQVLKGIFISIIILIIILGIKKLIETLPDESNFYWIGIIAFPLIAFLLIWLLRRKKPLWSFKKEVSVETSKPEPPKDDSKTSKLDDSKKSSKNEKKKASWKKFWRGLVIVLLALLLYVISLFFWKDGPWGINHTVRKMLSIPFTVLEGKHFKKGAMETVYIEPGGDVYYQADAAKGDWEIEVSNPDYPEDGSKKYGSNTPIDPTKKLHYGTLRIVFLTDARDFAVIANKR